MHSSTCFGIRKPLALQGFGWMLAAWLGLCPLAQAGPVKLEQRSLGGIPAQVMTIDLSDPHTYLDLVLANNAPRANSSQEQFGDEAFGSMVQRARASALVNGTFFSKDAQMRVMGNMVKAGVFVKYSRWENFGTTFGLFANNQPDMFTIRSGDSPRWDKHWFSITAGPRLLKDGGISVSAAQEGFQDPHVMNTASRSALGFTRDGKTLFLVSFLSALSLQSEAAAMKSLGAWQAMNMDGGASKALAFKGRVLMAPGRRLTNAIAVYDTTTPAAQALQQSRNTFQIAHLSNGDLPILSPDAPAHPITPTPTPTVSPQVATPAPTPTPTPTPTPQAAPTPAPDVMNHPQALAALAAPKYFFWYLYRKDYPKAWEVLTEASRRQIVQEILDSMDNPAYDAQKVRQAIDSNDQNFAPAFWDAFRQTIDSEKWVKHYFVLSWVNETDGLVLTQRGQLQLKVRREDGKWRFGFAESFK